MKILKVIARLMDYPNQDVASHKGDMALAISQSKEISPDHRAQLLETLHAIYDGELMDAEERYTSLFEQGRSLSLHLFEHVHGESRDRGQAMVDLMAEYARHGFELDAHELPDYIPMFLEYLSYRPDLEAREWLADVNHILAVLGARLVERQSPYAALFEALLLIAGCSEALDEKRPQVKNEEPDNTPEALDKEWEEVAVTFGVEGSASNGQACGQNTESLSENSDQAQVLHWKDAGSISGPKPKISGGQSL